MSLAKEILYTANLTGSLKLSANGEWFHNGLIFKNKRLSKLFHSSIVWDFHSREYFVEIGQQRARFDKIDTAYFVVSIDDTKEPWVLLLADESLETLNPASLSIGPENQIYCTVKGGHKARFNRQAFQTLAQYVIADYQVKIGSLIVDLKST